MASLSVLNILRTIKERGTISRTDLQHTTGLSWGTITNTTRDLLNRNLIREEGAQSTKAGRKPVRLAINPLSHSLIGIDLSPGVVRCQVSNLAGETLAYEEFRFELSDPPESVLERACQMAQRMLELPIISSRQCLGIGVAVPGYLDAERGVLRFSTRLPRWQNVAVRQYLQERLSPAVRLERDPNCLALAERWFGGAGQADDVLCVNLGESVGMGILAGGEVFRGSQQMAGEFGHMTVDPNGAACACGDRGCVAAYASIPAVREFVRSQPENVSPKLAAHLANGGASIFDIIAAAKDDDKASQAAFERLGRHLGIGIANLIDLLNPDLVVLAGPLTEAQEHFLPALSEELQRHTGAHATRRVVISQLGERAMATGACGIVLQSVFESSQNGSPTLQQA
jgi:predicted NBD/HSP70 family sugar kinase